jgi:hypothetical protein
LHRDGLVGPEHIHRDHKQQKYAGDPEDQPRDAEHSEWRFL